MPKPVYLKSVQETHKDYLINQIRIKFKQLDSGKFWGSWFLSIQPWIHWIVTSIWSYEQTF